MKSCATSIKSWKTRSNAAMFTGNPRALCRKVRELATVEKQALFLKHPIPFRVPSNIRTRLARRGIRYTCLLNLMGELGAGMDEVLASKVIAQIAAVKRIPVDSITIDSTFKELAMDSLDAMNLLFALEEQLGISIPDEEASSIRDVRGALTAVKQKLSEQSEASS